MPAKATKTIKQALSYKPQHAAYFAETQALFNRVVGFYFEVIQAHQLVLELSSKEALTALEKLTHTMEQNPRPVMPLSEVCYLSSVRRYMNCNIVWVKNPRMNAGACETASAT